MVRAFTAKSDFPQLKNFMQELFQDANQQKEVQNFSVFVQYIA